MFLRAPEDDGRPVLSWRTVPLFGVFRQAVPSSRLGWACLPLSLWPVFASLSQPPPILSCPRAPSVALRKSNEANRLGSLACLSLAVVCFDASSRSHLGACFAFSVSRRWALASSLCASLYLSVSLSDDRPASLLACVWACDVSTSPARSVRVSSRTSLPRSPSRPRRLGRRCLRRRSQGRPTGHEAFSTVLVARSPQSTPLIRGNKRRWRWRWQWRGRGWG